MKTYSRYGEPVVKANADALEVESVRRKSDLSARIEEIAQEAVKRFREERSGRRW